MMFEESVAFPQERPVAEMAVVEAEEWNSDSFSDELLSAAEDEERIS